MRRLFCLLVATSAACAWSAGAVAQTKVTGTHVCSKPDPQHMLPAGDRADHNFAVEQLKCNHTKPMEIGADKAKDGVATDAAMVSGLAPGSRTWTLTVAGSAFGNKSTPRSRNEKIPSTTSDMTSIVAKTGRRTQSSDSISLQAPIRPADPR